MTAAPSTNRGDLPASTCRQLRCELLKQLREAPGVDVTVARGVAATLRSACGRSVTHTDVRRVLPTLQPIGRFDHIDLSGDDGGTDGIEAMLPVPEELDGAFWSSVGFAMYPYVLDIRSGTRPDHLEVHLLSDGRNDWWYTVPVSNYGGGWELGPPTRPSRLARRREISTLIRSADCAIADPFEVRTSLTGVDYQWAAHQARLHGLVTRHRPGRLRSLTGDDPSANDSRKRSVGADRDGVGR